MIPIMQTDLTFETGNCGEACIASILELELSDILIFGNPDNPEDGKFYCKSIRNFLNKFGYSYIDIEMSKEYDPIDFLKDCWVIATGKSPRATKKEQRHAVVWKNGEIIHDPHPSGDGLKEIEMYGVFIKMNPSIKRREK